MMRVLIADADSHTRHALALFLARRLGVAGIGEAWDDASLERELAARSRLEQRIARLQQQIEQGQTADRQMNDLHARVADLEAQLNAQAYAPEEHAALIVCHEQQSALAARLTDEDYAHDAREQLQATLAARNLRLTLSEPVIDMLADKGYDAKMGARPLSRKIDELIRVPLSKKILFDQLENCTIHAVMKDDVVDFVIESGQATPVVNDQGYIVLD